VKTQYRIMTAIPARELIGSFIQSSSRFHWLSNCAFVFKTYAILSRPRMRNDQASQPDLSCSKNQKCVETIQSLMKKQREAVTDEAFGLYKNKMKSFTEEDRGKDR